MHPTATDATNRSVGDTIRLSVPLYEGGVVDLAQHRNRPMLLAISASWTQDWTSFQAFLSKLARHHGDALEVVVIADEPAARLLSADLESPLTIATDPQGAVAAQLHVTVFPTVLFLSARGEVAGVYSGSDPDTRVAIEGHAAALVR